MSVLPSKPSLLVAALAGIIAVGGLWFHARRSDLRRERLADTKAVPGTQLATNDRVAFVGTEACRECHAEITEAYLSTGMGRSLSRVNSIDLAEPARFSPDGHHAYQIESTPDGVFHHESLTANDGQSIYDQAVKIDYVLGSGHQGHSYLIDRGGLLFMSPIGWYSRAQRWDLSPGYKLPSHPRFERLVTEGCLECHAGQINAIATQENRFHEPPFLQQSIGCERCHGPGHDHIQFRRGKTFSKDADPIVNPARLDPSRREDVCNQCHLQGEGRYLREGCHFGEFQPGQRLEDVYVILVQGTRATTDGQTQSISQVEQMRSSICFQKSAGRLGCISCHDPHRQPLQTELTVYHQEKCLTCHSNQGCNLPQTERLKQQVDDSCIACHMPRLNASDVPHTTQTDHRILRLPQSSSRVDHAQSDQFPEVFDGAEQRLPRWVVDRVKGIWLAEQAEIQRNADFAAHATRLLTIVARKQPKDGEVLNALGTAAAVEGRLENALTFWKQALAIDPNRELTLRSTANLLQKLGRHEAARVQFEKYLEVQPWSGLMWGRYSLSLGQLGQNSLAVEAARKSVELDPSNARMYQWLADLYGRLGDQDQRRRNLELFERFARSPQ